MSLLFNVRRLAVTGLLTVVTLAVQAAEEVNVYSYRQPFLIKPMFDVFTKETGIKVNTVFADTGLVERLKQEGDNSPADLIFTVDIGRLSDAFDAGVTQPVQTETLLSNIPQQYRHPEGHWYGLTTRVRIIVASKERVQPGEIKSYEDLADPKWQDRICTRSGKHVYNVALIASMIEHHGAEAAQTWLTAVKDNLARKPQGNDRNQVEAIYAGECDVAVINNYYMGVMASDEEQSAWADSVNIIFPNQETRGAHVNISGMALTKSAPNKENAIKLMEFLSSDLAQQMYAEQNYEYPIKEGVTKSGLLLSWGDFSVDPLPLVSVSDNRSEAVKMVDIVGFDE
jgi:iron(III) transport system substrate-binding protein